jgi:hypothetical protein
MFPHREIASAIAFDVEVSSFEELLVYEERASELSLLPTGS